jgi:hypothetical protein
MGEIIASCGHTVIDMDELKQVVEKAWTKDNQKAIEYSMVCERCFKLYNKAGINLTEEEREEWLNYKEIKEEKENYSS